MGFLKKLAKKALGADPITKKLVKKDPIAKKVLGSKLGQRMAKLDPGMSSVAKGMRKPPTRPATGMGKRIGQAPGFRQRMK